MEDQTPPPPIPDLAAHPAGPKVSCVVAACVLVALALVAYVPALDAGFIFDDSMYLTSNAKMGSIDGLVRIWTEVGGPEYRHQYYPMTSTVWWLEHRLFGDEPFGYHLVNVLLHAANAILLWRLLRRLSVPGAWVAGAIFAVHPVHVQSVAWISELKNVLSTFFFLMSAGVFVGWLLDPAAQGKEEAAQRRSGAAAQGEEESGLPSSPAPLRRSAASPLLLYATGLLLFIAALLSKTATCLLPVALALLVWWKHGRLSGRAIAGLLPLVVVGGLFVSMTVYLEGRYGGAAGAGYEQGLVERSLLAGRAAWFYASKLAWPTGLALVYPKWEVDPAAWSQWLYPAGVVITLAVLWLLRRELGRGPAAAAAYFVIAVAPISFVNVAFTRFSWVADHWQYWASMGFIALFAAMLVATAGTSHRALQVSTWTAVIPLLAILTWLSWQRTHVFRSEWTVWADTVAKNPGCWQAQYNMGIALADAGRGGDAIVHYRDALRAEPNAAVVHNNLGIELGATGRYKEAIHHFREALRIDPRSSEARVNLGESLCQTRRCPEGMREYREALRMDPSFAGAHFNLGIALRSEGNVEEAIHHFRETLRLEPDAFQVHNNLGEALMAQGRTAEAVQHYERALHLMPDWAPAHFNLAIALESVGRHDEALGHFRRAVSSAPEIAEVHNRLGTALLARGETAAAAKYLREAVRLRPEWTDPTRALGRLLASDPDPRVRDPMEAIRLLESLLATEPPDPELVDSLATAYAHAGRFGDAAVASANALVLAVSAGADDLAAEIEQRLLLHALGREPDAGFEIGGVTEE